jgi:hypothetical protein
MAMAIESDVVLSVRRRNSRSSHHAKCKYHAVSDIFSSSLCVRSQVRLEPGAIDKLTSRAALRLRCLLAVLVGSFCKMVE